ncbi:MAG: Na(+)-translocating NADH-quinone reductase subunit A [Muribaculum sp.]|nr:Na(+)-translocating NADH-quinone reductase subunit A [Muribaculum sp.]
MARLISIRKGLDINISGAAPQGVPKNVKPALCAVVPDDFKGIVPKVDVKEGDTVLVGTPLFHDKKFYDIKVVSPVAGTVEAVVRGERRKLERIVIKPADEPDKCITLEAKPSSDPVMAQRLLLDSGLWALMRQRPYGIVPKPGGQARDIFITAFDSAPLAPDFEATLTPDDVAMADAAIKFIQPLTEGNIYIGIRHGSKLNALRNAEVVEFEGPHPTGNVGVQICNVKPVNKGDVVWTLDLPTLLRIGKLITTGRLSYDTVVAVTGCKIESPEYVSTVAGADMASLLKDNLSNEGHTRIIAGNVLTGIPVGRDHFLRYPYYQVTAIPEGDDQSDFMGWASLSPDKMSVNHSFPGHFLKRAFCPDARLHGGRRAMIMSGVYEKVLPMDIMPEYLIKACLAKNIERMEQLGIYEIVPEDIALCEYIDPSKLELQKILQEGLDYLYNELS